MIRPNSHLAAGVLLLCAVVGGRGEDLRPEATSSIIPAGAKQPAAQPVIPLVEKPVGALPKPAEPKRPTEVAPTYEVVVPVPPIVPPPLPRSPKREVPPLVKESPNPATQPKLPVRVGRAELREIDEQPAEQPVAPPADTPNPRKPAAIDPKDMAPADLGKVKMPAMPIRRGATGDLSGDLSGMVSEGKSPSLSDAEYVRTAAVEAGMGPLLSDTVASVVTKPKGHRKRAPVRAGDRWVVQSCEALHQTPEGERMAAFLEILRAYKRKQAVEDPATR